jgi:hypothetical protein
MKKGFSLLVLFVCAIILSVSASASSLTLINSDESTAVINILNAVDVYSYEVVLNFTGNIDTDGLGDEDFSNFAQFLGIPDEEATYSYDIENNLLYVYGSKRGTGSGVSGSGNLFNISHFGGSISLWSFTEINTSDISSATDGSYTSYVPEAELFCGDNTCNNGESCSTCSADCGACPAQSPGGGGSTTVTQYYSLKIITPGEITISDSNYINIPLSITNTGITDLTGINLKAEATLEGSRTDDIAVVLAKNYIPVLPAGRSENFDVRINVNTKSYGRYKLTVFADVTSPKISDWGEFYIELKKVEANDAEQNLIFAEKLINKNSECIELNEALKEARRLYDEGDYRGSVVRLKEAVDACTALVSKSENSLVQNKNQSGIFIIMALLTLSLLVLGLILYIYKRSRVNY